MEEFDAWRKNELWEGIEGGVIWPGIDERDVREEGRRAVRLQRVCVEGSG